MFGAFDVNFEEMDRGCRAIFENLGQRQYGHNDVARLPTGGVVSFGDAPVECGEPGPGDGVQGAQSRFLSHRHLQVCVARPGFGQSVEMLIERFNN
jgi:hypothetical protein